MIIVNKCLKINSSSDFQIIDISHEIKSILDSINNDDSNEIRDGIVNIFTKHSTSAICVNENEKGLLVDFENALRDIVPEKNGYRHDIIDNNAASHIRSLLLGSSETIPIADGKLDLGTWQSIFFIELDGPRKNRCVNLTFIG